MFLRLRRCTTKIIVDPFYFVFGNKIMNAIQLKPRGVISTFSCGPNFFLFSHCHRTIEKLEKQHFICSNFTLFIVLFFLFLFFSLFFLLFLSFFLFFLLFFFLGGWGRRSPSPLKWRPWLNRVLCVSIGCVVERLNPSLYHHHASF